MATVRIDAASLVVTQLPKADVFRCEPEVWQATIKGTEDQVWTTWADGVPVKIKHVRLREFCASGHTREDALCALGDLVSKLGAVA